MNSLYRLPFTIIFVLYILSYSTLHAQTDRSDILNNETMNGVWTFGGTEDDIPRSIMQTSDGGFVIAGTTESENGDFKGFEVEGVRDAFVMKLTPAGEIEWLQTFGGSRSDSPNSAVETTDSAILVAGRTDSGDGDFEDGNEFVEDIFVIRLSSSGETEWLHTFGGTDYDAANAIAATDDGGSIVTGEISSGDGDFDGLDPNNFDIFAMKLSPSGEMEWIELFGGSATDTGHDIIQTDDGGYILTGSAGSLGGDFDGLTQGLYDIFAIKLSPEGDTEWISTFGGMDTDIGNSVLQVQDGGFLITGVAESDDLDFEGIHPGGSSGIFAIKLDASGETEWINAYGGTNIDISAASTLAQNGGFVLTGTTMSEDGDFEGVGSDLSNMNAFAMHIAADGDVVWVQTYGAGGFDIAESVGTTADGGYVLTGSTTSGDGYFEGADPGSFDVFMITTDAEGNITTPTSVDPEITEIPTAFTLEQNYPNPFNPATTIEYGLPEPSHVTLEVFNITGQRVSVLVDEVQQQGTHQVSFDATGLSSGIYFYRLKTGNSVLTRKSILLK